jgi:hypothetical protein
MKLLRKVYGPINEKGVWRFRTNQELRELYKTASLVAGIKRRLELVIRMDQTRMPKKCLECKQKAEET